METPGKKKREDDSQAATSGEGSGQRTSKPPQRAARRTTSSNSGRPSAKASWIFGSLLLAFVLMVFVFAPPSLPDYKQKLLAVFCGTLAGFFAYFFTGTIAIKLTRGQKNSWQIGVQAVGGFGIFALTLWWWTSGIAPIKPQPGFKTLTPRQYDSVEIDPSLAKNEASQQGPSVESQPALSSASDSKRANAPDAFIGSISGVVVNHLDNSRLPGADVHVTNVGERSCVASKTGEFTVRFKKGAKLKPGQPIVFYIPNWIIIRPYDGMRGRMFLPDREAETVQIVVGHKGENDLIAQAEIGHIVAELVLPLASTGSTSDSTQDSLIQMSEHLGISVPRLTEAITQWTMHAQAPYERALAALYNGHYKDAEYYLAQAATVAKSSERAWIYAALSNAKFNQGDYQAAEKSLRSVLGLRPNDPLVLSNLGLVARSRGDSNKARVRFIRALAVQEALMPNSPQAADIFRNLGDLAKSSSRLTQSELYFKRAIDIYESNGRRLAASQVLADIASVALDRGEFSQAEELYLKALNQYRILSSDNLRTADVFAGLGQLMREKRNPDRAEEYDQQAYAIRKKLAPESPVYAQSLNALGLDLREKGKPESAARLFEEALAILQTQKLRTPPQDATREALSLQYSRVSSNYINLLMEKGKPQEALMALEQSRTQGLLATLAAGEVQIENDIDPALLRRQRSLQESLVTTSERRLRLLNTNGTPEGVTSINADINRLMKDYEDTEKTIRSQNSAYAALMNPQSLTIHQLQQFLDKDTVLLEYSLGGQSSYLWLVSDDAVHVYGLPSRLVIESTARRFYYFVNSVNRRRANAASEQDFLLAARKLSEMILGPVRLLIAGKRLVVVADGVLQYVPFAALPDPTSGSGSSPLVSGHEIVSLPSISVLALTRERESQRKPARESIAVLGDPVFEKNDERVRLVSSHLTTDETVPDALERSASDIGLDQGGELRLPRLSFSRLEAEAVLSAMSPAKSLKAFDFQASRTAAISGELSKYRTIHFATHTLLNSEHPELSGLVFSLVDQTGRPQNGFMGLQDIYNLKLNADLVVLSACETGLGNSINREGLSGLTRGFMYAGANRVMASLWNVDDESKTEFMRRFYRELANGMSASQALRTIQMEMIRDGRWNDPHFWAAFQIHGDWR